MPKARFKPAYYQRKSLCFNKLASAPRCRCCRRRAAYFITFLLQLFLFAFSLCNFSQFTLSYLLISFSLKMLIFKLFLIELYEP